MDRHFTTHQQPVSLRIVLIVLVGLLTACAPQAPLPTQAILPTQAEVSAPVNSAAPLPTDAPSTSPLREAAPAAADANNSTQSDMVDTTESTTSGTDGDTPQTVTVSVQPAPSSNIPTVRLLGVPQIALPAPAVPNVIVLQAHDSRSLAVQAQVDVLGGTISRDPALTELGVVIVTLPENTNPSQVARLAEIAQTEPDYYAVALADDPLVSQQWGRALLRLETAKVPADAPLVKVAVIDSGACFTHPDLAGQYLSGWDYVANDADPRDEFGHGCQVSGILAALQNNGLGMAGVSAQIRILPYRVLDGRGIGRYSHVSAAIVRAVQDGAQVINLSLGGPNTSTLLSEAVQYAQQAGVIVVAAAGNSGQPQVFYPAALEGVISVGAVGETRLRSSFSNYGKIDLWAAGENVLTTLMDGTYARVNGTSFAAPHVAGLAALEIATGRQLVIDGRLAAYGGAGDELARLPDPLPAPNPITTYTQPAMKNPAALNCTNLGHEYVIGTEADGSEGGACLMPDATECEQWDFYAGTCGQAFNFCAQQGYDTVTLSDGNDPFAPVYAACTSASGEMLGAVSDLSALDTQAAACEDGRCNMSLSEPLTSDGQRIDPASDPVAALTVPTMWDWRSYNNANWLTPIKNQGGCGSCGVFSAVGIIESAMAIAAGNPGYKPDLAEQYMISTCYQNPNTICGNGSHSDWTLAVAKNTGLCDEGCMPYQAQSTDCGTRCSNWSERLTKIADYGYVWTGLTQTYIKQLIVNRGPVATYLRISNGSYSNGYLTCSVDYPIDHAVVLVGYNDAGGYWIMRNSWGSSWGDSGYTKVRYGDCGIDSTYIAFASSLPSAPANTNTVRNGGFDSGTSEWETTGEVDWAVSSGVLYFKRPVSSPNGFGIVQHLNHRYPQNTPVEIQLELGNTSNVHKTIDVTLRNRNSWDGAQTCRFVLPPQSPLRGYTMQLVTGEWVSGRIEVGLEEADGLGNVLMDNVRVSQKSGLTALKCLYPAAEANVDLLHNGSFDLGKQGWQSADSTWTVAGGEATLVSKTTPQGGFYQNMGRRLSLNSPVEVTFTAKNPNASVLRSLKVTLIDDSNLNWGIPNLVSCVFTLPTTQTQFATYTIRGKVPGEMAHLRLHVEAVDAEADVNIVFGSFVVRSIPGLTLTTTECVAPSDNPPTSAPLLTLPASPTTDNTPTILIGSVPQGETYALEIDDENTFADPKLYTATLSTDALNHTTSPLPDDTLYVRARAVKNSNPEATRYGPWSGIKSLLIDTTSPAVPVLTLPVNAATISNTATPLLTWQAVSGASAYEVDLGTSNPPNQPLVTVTTASWTVNRALTTGVYYWRVRSRDSLGNVSDWSEVRFFTLQSPAGSAPRANRVTTSTPQITWTPLASAQGYQVQVAVDKLFTRIVYDNAQIPSDEWTHTLATLPNGAYFYRVRGKLASGWGAWSGLTPLVVKP